MHSMDILRKAKGDCLDLVHSDQKVLETIRRGRLVLSKLTQKRLLGSSPLRSDGSHDSRVGGWSV
jgi:hypothetical protein